MPKPENTNSVLVLDEAGVAATSAGLLPAAARSLVAGMVLMAVALNLRPALSSLAVLLAPAQHAFGLSGASIGVLTMMPSLCFGLAGGAGLAMARRVGLEKGLAVSLVIITAGLLLRVEPLVQALFAGTVLVGVGIGIAGVLVPAIIKRDYAGRIGLATGLYTMAMCGGGALGAAFTLPLANALGTDWNATIGLWAVPAGLATLAWLPFAAGTGAVANTATGGATVNLWRDGIAWGVTGFMTLQAALAFIVLGWLPAILQSRGLDPLASGYLTSASVFSQTLTALLVPIFAARLRGQKLLVVAALGFSAVGFAGLTMGWWPGALFWAVVLGLGQGANFGLALVFIGLRSANAGIAARLSSMSQSIGYTLAAGGPLLAGLVRQWSSAVEGQVILFAVIAFLALLSGLVAGAPHLIGEAKR